MLKEIDLQPAEKALDNARALMDKISDPDFLWTDSDAFKADIETATRLLADMRQTLSGLIVLLSEHAPVIYEHRLESEVGEAIHKSFNLLSHLYDDLHSIEGDGPGSPIGLDTLEKARVHFQKIISHYATTRDRLLVLEKEFGMVG